MSRENQMPPEPLLIDYKVVCRMLSIGKSAFFEMRQSGRFPVAPIKLGGSTRYDRRQVLAWIDAGCPADWREAKR